MIFESILNRTSVLPSQLNRGLPEELDRIIQKALEKDRDLRYQHASEMRADLKRLRRDKSSAQSIAATTSSAADPRPGPTTGSIADSTSALPSAMERANSNKRRTVGVIALLILLLGGFVGFGLFKFMGKTGPAINMRNLSVSKLTDHSQVVPGTAAVSRDGKLIAYVKREGERSLRVKQVATGSEVTIVPAQFGLYRFGLAFAPDGNYLYYVRADSANPNMTNVYSVPSLGGPSRKIVADVNSGVAFAPDGKRIVYRRTLADTNEDQLLVANADGSGERIVLQRKSDWMEGLNTDPSWSANGDLIAVGAYATAENVLGSILVLSPYGKVLKEFRLATGIVSVAWLPDLSGILFVGQEKSTGLRPQIWFQPYPDGEAFKFVTDLNYYESLGVTADGKSVVTAQGRPASTVYVGDSPVHLNEKIDWKLKPISTEQIAGRNLSWTAAGKLIQIDGSWHAFISSADGGDRVPMLENETIGWGAAGCGPGNIVVLSRIGEKNEQNLWSVDTASGELKQLTRGHGEIAPWCTPDGKVLVYMSQSGGLWRLLKATVENGATTELARGLIQSIALSPDGALVAFARVEGQGAGTRVKFIVHRLTDNSPIREFDAPTDVDAVGWTPDSRAITYLRIVGSVQNLYMRPLSGGSPVQLMHFDAEPSRIIAYAWSRDGKKIAITRNQFNDTDVVMFTGFR